MFTISSEDKSNLDSFSLLWRWNQSSHALFSDKELSLIEPLTELKALELHNLLMPIEEKLRDVKCNKIEAESPQIKAWLSRFIPADEYIFLSWHSSTAIRIQSSLFIFNDDDFCYPSSDDVFIYPESEKWLMQYHHSDLYTWHQLSDT